MSTSRETPATDTLPLSERVRRIGVSATMAAGERAQRLRRQGIEVLDLGPGQPDFETPDAIREAGIRAIREGKTVYTPAAGVQELRGALAEHYRLREGVEYQAEETIVTSGGKQGLYNAIMALIDPGDDVLIPTPYWVSFPEQVRLAGGRCVYVDTRAEDAFALTAEAVEAALTPRTRMVVVNTPSNPSGAVVPRAEMEKLARLALERGFWLLFDECYASLVYEGSEHVTPLALGKEAKEVTILCGSASKSYAMTGWRIGWVAAPRRVVDSMTKLQGHSTSNATSISQYAALEAITGDQQPVRDMLAVFAERRAHVVPRLRALPGVECVEPRGAFYAFPDVSALFGDQAGDSVDLASLLIDRAHVVTVPGVAFGRDGYLRLSYAASLDVLDEALARLEKTFAELLG